MSDWDSETQRRYDEDVAKGMPRLPGTQLAEPVTTNAEPPLLDRGALVKAIADEFNDYPEGLSFVTALDGGILPTSQVAALAAEAVMPLARPMPTAQQFQDALRRSQYTYANGDGDLTIYDVELADLVVELVALVAGDKS
jgi:hypothetical protein